MFKKTKRTKKTQATFSSKVNLCSWSQTDVVVAESLSKLKLRG